MAQLAHAPFDLISTLHDRMTGRQALDATVAVYGDKGVGKSEACMYLSERLDAKLCRTYGKPPGTFFSIDNVRSVDREGTLEMFTAEQFKRRKHQVFVVDDAGVAANARKFQTDINQRLNDILQVARIYRHCIFINTIAPFLIDMVLWSFANITCIVVGPDMNPESPTYEMNRLRTYVMSSGGAPAERRKKMYNKHFQFQGEDGRINRIVMVRTRRPSAVLLAQYEALRKEKTDALLDLHFLHSEPNQEKLMKAPKRTNKAMWEERAQKFLPTILEMHGDGRNTYDIMRATGLSSYAISKLIGMGVKNDG
jgi:hypothetical protein